MGLYIKLQRNYDTDEKSLLHLYQLLIERLTEYFKFRPLNDYILWNGDFDEEELKKPKILMLNHSNLVLILIV